MRVRCLVALIFTTSAALAGCGEDAQLAAGPWRLTDGGDNTGGETTATTNNGPNNATNNPPNNTTGGTPTDMCDSDAACGGGSACAQRRCVGGVCVTTTSREGAPCDDGDACTMLDVCVAGVCEGRGAVQCDAPPSGCFIAAACDPATGACGAPAPAPDGAPCEGDGVCEGGACVVVLAVQDFEQTPHPRAWAYTSDEPDALTFAEGVSGEEQEPPFTPIGVAGSRAWRSARLPQTQTITLPSVRIPEGKTARLHFNLAAMNLAMFGSTGVGGRDYVLVELSDDGGQTFHPRMRITGSQNNDTLWPYSAQGVARVRHPPTDERLFRPQDSGVRLIDGLGAGEVIFEPSVRQVAARFTLRAPGGGASWLLDDIILTAQ